MNIVLSMGTLAAVLGFNITALGMALEKVPFLQGSVVMALFMWAFVYTTEKITD